MNPAAKIEIVMDANGNVQMQTQIPEPVPIVFLGMMERAKLLMAAEFAKREAVATSGGVEIPPKNFVDRLQVNGKK